MFAAFRLDPNPVIKSIGLSLAFGVPADAFVVRMTLVPAVDIEGERLAKGLSASPSPS